MSTVGGTRSDNHCHKQYYHRSHIQYIIVICYSSPNKLWCVRRNFSMKCLPDNRKKVYRICMHVKQFTIISICSRHFFCKQHKLCTTLYNIYIKIKPKVIDLHFTHINTFNKLIGFSINYFYHLCIYDKHSYAPHYWYISEIAYSWLLQFCLSKHKM